MTEHTTTRRRDDALRAALADMQPIAAADPFTRAQLAALTADLADLCGELEAVRFGNDDPVATILVTPRLVGEIRRATAVVRAAAAYGYPRPALEQLGAQAGHLPASRSSDPATARVSGERTRSTPSARNHLGRLLRAFRIREVGAMPDDPAMTSEEAARRARLLDSEYAKRCSDLAQLGYLRVATDDDGHERTRQGASGRQRLVFELTDDGRRLADHLLAS